MISAVNEKQLVKELEDAFKELRKDKRNRKISSECRYASGVAVTGGSTFDLLHYSIRN
jgi:peptidase E